MTADNNSQDLELLASEYMERLRRGESPSVEEYEKKYPELAAEIRELFPAISAMEVFKKKRDQSPRGPVSLGAPRFDRLGDFRIVGEIGRGGMGIVYEAEQENLGRRVALKVLPRSWSMTSRGIQRFKQEARITARLEHPNIVPIFGLGHENDFHFIIMPRIMGVGLDRLIQELGRPASLVRPATGEKNPGRAKSLPELVQNILGQNSIEKKAIQPDSPDYTRYPAGPRTRPTAKSDRRADPASLGPNFYRQAAALGVQACRGLHYAHLKGTCHRDIKPANILLDVKGQVRITDFGLAKALLSEESTTTGNVMGTMRFMAPEQFSGRADGRSDVYGLGLTLYELVTLKPAFSGSNPSELINKILHEKPVPPRRINRLLPRPLETVILRAMARNPEHRYQTAQAMADDLNRFLQGQKPQKAPAQSIRGGVGFLRESMNRPLAWIMLVLLFIAGGLFYYRQAPPPPAAGPPEEATTHSPERPAPASDATVKETVQAAAPAESRPPAPVATDEIQEQMENKDAFPAGADQAEKQFEPVRPVRANTNREEPVTEENRPESGAGYWRPPHPPPPRPGRDPIRQPPPLLGPPPQERGLLPPPPRGVDPALPAPPEGRE